MDADNRRHGWDEAMVDILVEFLEAAVHCLLHARRLYPPDIFERRRKYGVPMWMSRHPELNSYIYEVLLRARSLMEHGVVRKVLVCFFKEAEHVDQAPVERVAFAFRVDEDEGGGGSVDPLRLQDVEDQLRSALLQIQKSSAHLPTRQGCTFALHVEAHEEEEVRAGRHDVSQEDGGASPVSSAVRGGKWLLAENDALGVAAEPGQRKLVPIKSVRGRGLALDLSAEMGDCPA